jgi:WD40 repeat protein
MERMPRPTDFVRGAAFTKDEARILSWSADKMLRLWDAATRQQIGPAMKHDYAVEGAVFSKNETRILSWSSHKTLRLWDTATGQPIGPAMKHDGRDVGSVSAYPVSRRTEKTSIFATVRGS